MSDSSDALSILTLSHNEQRVPESKRTRFLATYQRQVFSLPKTIIYNMVMNPTPPESYQKMTKTCKWFFIQNPVIILSFAYYKDIQWQKFFDCECILELKPCPDLNKITSKFWITNKYYVWGSKKDKNLISHVFPKNCFRFDAKELSLANLVMSYNDYVYLTASAVNIYLLNVTMKNENGDDLSLEKLVEPASKVKTFECLSDTVLSNITSKTFGELLKLPHFLELDFFDLKYIPETFDLEAFYTHIKKNKCTHFEMKFDNTISVDYKNRLEEIIDEILTTENREYRIPFINFSGLALEKFTKLFHLSHAK